MSPNDFATTSRRALIVGMTNSDQVGMQQARGPQAAATIPDHAERLSDAGDGGDNGGGADEGEINEATGLTPELQAEFDRMASGDPGPPGDPAEGDDGDGDGDGDPDPAEPAPQAPAPAAEKTPAQLAAEAAQGQKPPPKYVPFGKHQRELKKAQTEAEQARAEAQTLRENQIKLGERLAIINEALAAQAAAPAAPAAPAAEEPPANPFDEPDIDPTEDYAASVLQERRRNRYAYEAAQGVQQNVAENQQDRDLRETFTRDFQAVAAQPDYAYLPQAYQFLKDARLTQIFLSEFDKDPNDANEVFTKAEIERAVGIFNGEEKWLVGNAIKNKKSPAHAILKQAKIYGFKPAAAAAPAAAAPAAPARPRAPAAPQVPAVRNGTGQPPVAPAAPTAAQALADLAAAQEAGRSLSDGGGAPPEGLTADLLLRMDDEEFAELLDSLPAHQLAALMGRGPG